MAQQPVYAGNIEVRVNGDPAPVEARVRTALKAIEPNLPVSQVTTLADEVGDALVGERTLAELACFFAALALLLSAIGLYGTISFTVARRTSEIGIRMALGAERSGVLGMVLKDAMTLVVTGVAIGCPVAFAASYAMRSLVYGLSGFDFLSAGCAVLTLSAVAAVAGYLPARRAARIDPITALRYE
jgi:ABC-type lipoprotein release transport system permease subunit